MRIKTIRPTNELEIYVCKIVSKYIHTNCSFHWNMHIRFCLEELQIENKYYLNCVKFIVFNKLMFHLAL